MKVLYALLLTCSLVLGANRYVRQGASGAANGNDWTDAWTTLPNPLTRGDTYYIADGAYASYTFDDAVDGSLVITIKKATGADHGTETGWDNSYGDGRATWTAPLSFTSSYWEMDGQVGGGWGSMSDTNSYGFGVYYTGSANGVKLITTGTFNHPDNLTFRRIDACYVGDIGGTTATDHDAFYFYGDGANSVTNVLVSYCALRHPGRTHVILNFCSDVTFEHCYFYWNRECTSQHAESVADACSSRVIFRYNLFRETMGTAIIGVLSRGTFGISDNWELYGNVFFAEGGQAYNCTDAAIVVINSQEANGWKIYNNTFCNLDGSGTTGDVGINFNEGTTTTGGHQIYNNLWYDSGAADESPNITWSPGDTNSVHDYSWWMGLTSLPTEDNDQVGTIAPFADFASLDFHLLANTLSGYDVGAGYNTDPDGVSRTTWSRGAFEFVSEGTPPVISDASTTPTAQTTATAQWTTDETCNTNTVTVWNAAGTNTFTASNGTSHSAAITGLTASTLYTNWFTSFDLSGNGTTNTAFTFTTLSATNDPTLPRVRITGGVTISGGVTIR